MGEERKRKKKRKARGEHQRIAIHRSIRKDGSNQTANFPKPNIILILADDVGGILVMPHSMWFVDYLDCSQKEERKLHKQNPASKTLSLVHALTTFPFG